MNRAELRSYILLVAGRIAKWSTVTGLSSKWGYLRLSLPPVDRAEGEQENTQPARNMAAFGVRSAPVVGSEVVVVAPRAGSTNATVIASDHLGYGPTDLAEGEVVIYSSAHKEGAVCVIRLDTDGNVTVIPKAGAKVRLGDSVAGNLDAVALYTQLKSQYDDLVSKFNAHTHGPGTFSCAAAPGPVAGIADAPVVAQRASAMTSAVASSNVVAKKP